MTAARPAIGSPCRSSGWRAVALYLKAPRHCKATQTTGGPLAGADTVPPGAPVAALASQSQYRNEGSVDAQPSRRVVPAVRDNLNATTSAIALVTASVCWAEWWNLQRHCLAESSTGVHAGCYTACDVAPVVTRGIHFNGRNAGADRIEERVAVGEGSHASDALICAATHAGTTRRIKREIDTRPSTHFPGNGARGPGVAAFKSTAAAPVFNSSNVHGCKA